ncbi:DNA repair protein RecO [Candidatus Saganbacteria bacterium]|nr:DNA repair protein RecO [Candidatus Saganbacteria bacterium]
MAAYKTKAISLKAVPFAEADKLVTLFTRDFGKIRAVAKSARKIPSRLAGRVEPLTYADYFIAKGRNLDIISQCQVIETFQKVRQDHLALPAGLYMVKLVICGTAEGQHYPELFDLLLKGLELLKAGGEGRQTARNFEQAFVKLEGIYREDVSPHYALSDHLDKDLSQW